jgi:hypothetical protein
MYDVCTLQAVLKQNGNVVLPVSFLVVTQTWINAEGHRMPNACIKNSKQMYSIYIKSKYLLLEAIDCETEGAKNSTDGVVVVVHCVIQQDGYLPQQTMSLCILRLDDLVLYCRV